MLVLSRYPDESIVIDPDGDRIRVTIIEVHGDRVRLGIEAPDAVVVHRQEVQEAIERSRKARGMNEKGGA